MSYPMSTVFAALCLLYGIIISSRVKLMVKEEYETLFMTFLGVFVLMELNYGFNLMFIGILPISILIILITSGRYVITNMKAHMVSSILIDILKEKEISFEEENNIIFLKDYDNKRIAYKQVSSSVVVNMKDIRNLSLNKELEAKLKSRIKKIDTIVFPTQGLFFIVIGIVSMVAIYHL